MKKWICVLLAVCMLAGLTACRGSKGQEGDKPSHSDTVKSPYLTYDGIVAAVVSGNDTVVLSASGKQTVIENLKLYVGSDAYEESLYSSLNGYVSGDGQRALFLASDHYDLFYYDGASLKRIPGPRLPYAMSFDGTRYAYADEARTKITVVEDGREADYSVSFLGGTFGYSPAGALFYAESSYDGNGNPTVRTMVLRDGEFHPLTDGRQMLVALSANEKTALSLALSEDLEDIENVVLLHLETGKSDVVLADDDEVAWLQTYRGGDWIFMTEEKTFVSIDGGAPVQIANQGYDDVRIILPRQTQIGHGTYGSVIVGTESFVGAYLEIEEEDNTRIARINADGTGTTVATGIRLGESRLASDGSTLFVLTAGNVRVINGKDGSLIREIPTGAVRLAIDRKGETVVYSQYDSAKGAYDLLRASAREGDPVHIGSSAYENFAMDASGNVFYLDAATRDIMKNDGTETKVLLSAEGGKRFTTPIANGKYVMVLDTSMCPGESYYHSTAYFFFDGEEPIKLEDCSFGW